MRHKTIPRTPIGRTARAAAAGIMAAALVATGLPGARVAPAAAAPVGQGFNLNASDLRFIMKQMRIAERHASTQTAGNQCGTLVGDNPDQIPTGTGQTIELPWGLRTVDGSCNHLKSGQETFGTADQTFPRALSKELRDAETVPPGFGPPLPTSYTQTAGNVFDSQPRVISNLIVDQTANNPAAVIAAGPDAEVTPSGAFFIPNTAPDVGLSAPFNSWFTLFGQFFDHGLDLVNKGGNGTVFIPLQPDDPLFAEASAAGTPFMLLSRATQNDNDHEAVNQTSPWVDQSQTYTSHPSHQVFLREYELVAGRPVGTGGLITGPGDGMATWADVKAQAATILGISLEDEDALAIPLLATDPYGRFLRGDNGFPQVVFETGLVEGNPAAPISVVGSVKTGHAFLDDIAHTAAPGGGKTPDADLVITPGEPAAGTFDDELLDAHFIAGDGRVNENIGLTAVHHVFHSEHNRLVAEIDGMVSGPGKVLTDAETAEWQSASLYAAGWDYAERLFQAARFVTEMEYQHLAFEEFIRKVQPMVNVFGGGGTGFNPDVNPAIKAEFAHAVYRFGHSMLTESVDRVSAAGVPYNIPLIDAFLNPPSFFDGLDPATDPEAARKAAGSIVRGMTAQIGNEIDEFVTEALRNRLLGLPLDLAVLNMARGRETGIPRLNQARREFYAVTQNSALAPYQDWGDFGVALRHPESLENFIAAFGTHPSITGATTLVDKRAAAAAILAGPAGADGILDDDPLTIGIDEAADNGPADSFDFLNSTGAWEIAANGRTTTGVDDIDYWVGGLAEKQMVFGGLLGPTFNYIFETQMEDLQDGDRFYYLSRTVGLNLLTQLEGNSFAELIHRNTDAEGLPADAFSRPAFVFNVAAQTNPAGIVDDPNTEYDESTLLVRLADGTIRYAGPEHVVFNGTAVGDRVWSSEGDDTIRGNDADDWMQGGDGNDNLIGGLGDDILLDSAGDETIKGGDGNDAISSGQGFGGDLNQGGRGKDFIVGGNDITESFAGPGDDFVYAGDAEDTVFGDDGDDWIEGGRGPFDLLQGDNGAPFQDDPNEPGHDVIIGYGGEKDYDAEGGDDVMFLGSGIQRAEGMLGFDWATHKDDPNPGDSDMFFTLAVPPTVETNKDRFDLVEALSGWIRDDILRGDDRTTGDLAAEISTEGHELLGSGVSRIAGLEALVPQPANPDAIAFNTGNILLGGAGSDILEGRGGDDILDGDRWLDAQIRVNPVVPGVAELHDSMATLRSAVFAGQVNPGNLFIHRTIKIADANPLHVDTAVFSGPRADYDVVNNPNGSTTVTHSRGTATDGADTLRNVELLQFADQTVNVATPGAVTLALSPSADTFVRGGTQNANVNFGTSPTLRSQQQGTSTGVSRTYLKFAVPAINQSIDSVKLRLYVADASTSTQRVYAAGNGWTEASLTFNNAAAQAPRGAQLLAQTVPVGLNYVELPLPISAVTSSSDVSFEIAGGSDLAIFNSREATANFPQLVITLGGAPTPATAPGAPTNVNAVAGNASATVSWAAPASNGGSAILSYTATSSPGGLTCTTAGLTCAVAGLTNGTTYTFTVTATNAIGTGPASAVSNNVTPATVPGAPTVATAIAGNASANVSWTAPTSDGGSAILSYTVTSNPGGLTCTTLDGNTTTCDVAGLTNGTSYTFTVRATNAVGTGPASAASNAVTPTAPVNPPTALVITPSADAYVRSGGQANRNFGTATSLQTREGGANNTFRTYLRFAVSGITGTVSGATLRLFVTDPSANAQSVRLTVGGWTETGITFSNDPDNASTPVATFTPNAAGYVDITLAAGTVVGNGDINLYIQGSGNDAAIFHSREAANDPQLVITQAP